MSTMNAEYSETEEEPPPFAIDEKEIPETPLKNLIFSPATTSSTPRISQERPKSPFQQQESSRILDSSHCVEINNTTILPTNQNLVTTTTNFFTQHSGLGESSLTSKSTQDDTHSIATSSTSSMNSSGSNASSSSHNQLPPLSTGPLPSPSPPQQPRMQASSTIMASSLFTVPLNSDSTMSLKNSRHAMIGSDSSSSNNHLTGSMSRMRFSQLMQTADDSDLPAVPEDEALESFEIFRNSEDAALILPAPHQVPNYNPTTRTDRSEESNQQWFFNLLSAARLSSRARNQAPSQITILDASTSGLNAPLLLASPPQLLSPFTGAMDRARARVMTKLEDSDSFEVFMDFNTSSSNHQLSVVDIVNILSNPTNLQLWYDPIETLVVTSRSNDDALGGSGGSSDSQRQYEGEWIEATTTALLNPPCAVSPLYELESCVRTSLGMGCYGKITIFREPSQGRVTLTVGPFPGGIHVRHDISVDESSGQIKIVDRVKLETRDEDASMFQNALSLGGILNKCILPPVASYMEQVKNSMAKLMVLVESGQVNSYRTTAV